MKFSELELHPALQAGIDKLGFEECTDIQAQSIPYILKKKDLAGLAQTGTGKTAAFLLPLMERVLRSKEESKPQVNSEADAVDGQALEELSEPVAVNEDSRGFIKWLPHNFILVLVPTRELAEQVSQNVTELCPNGEIKTVAVYGGASYDNQLVKLKEGVDVLVATPGRLIDFYKEHQVDLRQVRAVVFDEADRMFDMGFKDDMKYLLKRIDKERQFLVFSATLNFDVLNTAYEFGADPVEVNISKDQATADNVEDEIFHAGHKEKPQYLLSILRKHNPKQVIIFSNFKRNVERIALFLNKNGEKALGISSLLNQSQRNRVMEKFKAEGGSNILVATDVAARGLDIQGVDMVINYELPDDPENYVHRIGRTGRASAKGVAFSLVSDRDVEALARIEDYTRRKIDAGWIDDGDLVRELEAFPSDADLDYGDKKRSSNRRGGDRKGGDRDRKGGNRGRKPRRDAKDGEGNKRRSKDGNRRRRTAEGKDGEKREGANNAHRDRKTGRHKSKASSGKSRSKNRVRVKSKTGGKGRNNQRRPNKPAAAPKTLGQKVSGFIKKMFGNG